jgi:hypothetical protein
LAPQTRNIQVKGTTGYDLRPLRAMEFDLLNLADAANSTYNMLSGHEGRGRARAGGRLAESGSRPKQARFPPCPRRAAWLVFPAPPVQQPHERRFHWCRAASCRFGNGNCAAGAPGADIGSMVTAVAERQ